MLRMAYFSAIILAFALPVLPSNGPTASSSDLCHLSRQFFCTTAKNSSGITLLSEAKESFISGAKPCPMGPYFGSPTRVNFKGKVWRHFNRTC